MVWHLEFQLDKTDAYYATVTDFDTGSNFSERKSETNEKCLLTKVETNYHNL